jgi:F0F1-type ATP synthase assembly protein I
MNSHYKALGGYGTLGLEIALCILFGAWGGHWLDGKFGTAPVLLALGFFFGLGAAGKAVHGAWQQMQKEAAREEREQGNPAPLWKEPEKRERPSEPGEDAPRSAKDEHGEE